MKSISTINPAITKNTNCSIVEACSPVIDQNSECVAQSWRITMFRFQLLRTLWVIFQGKNSKKKFPASSALTKIRTEAIMHMPHTNHHLHSSGERN